MTELLKRLDGVQPPKPLPAARIALAGAAALLLVTAGALLFRHFNKTADDPVESPGGIIETDTGGEDEPEELHVVTLGTPNPNLLNYGGYAKIAQEYQYFIGGDNALYVCAYNKEDSTFYMGDAGKVYDMAGYITLGDGCVYFGSTIGAVHSLCRMDLDGGNIETIYSTSADSRGLNDLQYVKYSDGREYLYYSYENEENGSLFSLYRYDLSAGETEVVVESDLYWCNLYGDSIYYTERTDGGTRLMRADLDGQNGEELNGDAGLTIGFVADDTIFLWSYRDEALLTFELDGTLKSGFYDIEIDLDNFDIGYGEGWLYYVAADGNIRRIRANGTGDTVAMEGHTSLVMCVDQDFWVWFIENLPTGREHRYTQQAFISTRDGSTLFDIGESKDSWKLSDAYRGDLEYSKDAAEEKGYEGVFITGYTGVYTSIELPDEIDGLPVTGIAAQAFSESGIEEIGLPEGLRYIGEDAFYKCYDLTFAGLPDSLEFIDEAAFGSCSGLTSVEFPDGLKTIESLAFADTMLSEVRLPASVEWVGGGAFAVRAAAGLTEFRVAAGNKSIKSVDGVLYAYQGNYPLLMLISCPSGRGGSYEIPDGTRAVQNFAFAHCKQLTDVTVPETVLIIYANSFFDTGVTAVKVNSECDLRGTWDGSIAVSYY